MIFNRNPIVTGASITDPDDDEIRMTPALLGADLDTAARYGGDLTRAALGAMNLRGDRRNVIVDTKTHLLMPGFYPGIPGWHSDGVPRGPERNPAGKGAPDIAAQEAMDDVAPRFHLLVTGAHCPTRFATERGLILDVPEEPTPDLYAGISRQMRAMDAAGSLATMETAPSTVYEWDWWHLHTAQAATAHGWRFLIRVTETDHHEPRTDLSEIIRTQQQVYVPEVFGW